MPITLLEPRLALTHKRPSYQPTGTHPSPRSASSEDWSLAQVHCHQQAGQLTVLIDRRWEIPHHLIGS